MRRNITKPFKTRGFQRDIRIEATGHGAADQRGPLLLQQRQHVFLFGHQRIDLRRFRVEVVGDAALFSNLLLCLLADGQGKSLEQLVEGLEQLEEQRAQRDPDSAAQEVPLPGRGSRVLLAWDEGGTSLTPDAVRLPPASVAVVAF